MNKRFRRLPAAVSSLAVLALLSVMNPASATPPAELAWRLEAVPVGSSTTQFRDVRLVSSTTYVRASQATIDGPIVTARTATIHADGWQLSAETVSIDLRLDAVEFTPLRTDSE